MGQGRVLPREKNERKGGRTRKNNFRGDAGGRFRKTREGRENA